MTGRLDGALKWGAYASAELFLLPSRQENFAITVAEAMHMGVPVIIGDRVNTWPYVKEAGAGLVLDERRITTALETAVFAQLQDQQASRRMGERGKHYARKHLTWASTAARLVQCYQGILNPRNPVP